MTIDIPHIGPTDQTADVNVEGNVIELYTALALRAPQEGETVFDMFHDVDCEYEIERLGIGKRIAQDESAALVGKSSADGMCLRADLVSSEYDCFGKDVL
jgi:hypothetical protein